MDGNEDIAEIKSTIEFYYNQFKEFHTRNKMINNVAWGIFKSAKSLGMNTYCVVNAIKIAF